MLEELGLEYKAETIDISKNTQKEPWFLAINPNGRIPAIKDGDLRVFESGAILLYLTDKYDKENKFTFPQGTDDYYEMLSWVMWQMGGEGPMQGQANHFKAMAKVKSEYAISRYVDETKRLYSVLESVLKDHDYLVKDKYTIADIASVGWVRAAWMIEVSLDEFPGVKRWVERIEQREAVKKGLKVGASKSEDEMKEMFKGVSPRGAGKIRLGPES
jgi:glutathione S-transferase